MGEQLAMRSTLSGIDSDRRSAARYCVRSICVLETPDGPLTGRLRDISGTGAFIETEHQVAIGTRVRLIHSVAGAIETKVSRVSEDGLGLLFSLGDESVTFALRTVAAEMTMSAPEPGAYSPYNRA